MNFFLHYGIMILEYCGTSWIWWEMILLFLIVLDTRMLAQHFFPWIKFQHKWRLKAPFKTDRELKPRSPSLKILHHFFQAIVTDFLLYKSPLQMKFLIQDSIFFMILKGQLYMQRQCINMACTPYLTRCNLLVINNRLAFQAESFDLILSGINWKWILFVYQ